MTGIDRFPRGDWPLGEGAPDEDAYEATLGRIPRWQYDPNGFLASLGLDAPAGADGRDDRGMFAAWRLTRFQPEPEYLPAQGRSAWIGIQHVLLAVVRRSLPIGTALSLVIERLGVRDSMRTEPFPFGEPLDGQAFAVPSTARYLGVGQTAFERDVQHAFDSNFHEGSISRKNDGVYGTCDIALALGMTPDQATRIARTNFDVDEDKTPLHGKDGRPRKTSSANGGDLQLHYNRARPGEEDTRLQAARYRLDDALRLAKEAKYDAAEESLGLGLHSLQDVFAHAQIAAITHVLLGSFPDHLPWSPASAYDAELATEAYLRRYLDAIGVGAAPRQPFPLPDGPILSLAEAIARASLPADIARLVPGEVRFFVTNRDLRPTALGFGFSGSEGTRRDGRHWDEIPAGYDGVRAVGFIDGARLAGADGPALLRHELLHAVVQGLPKAAVEGELRRARDAGLAGRGPSDAEEFLTTGLASLSEAELSQTIARLQTHPRRRSSIT